MSQRQAWRPYAASLLLVAAATGLGLMVRGRVTPTNLVMLYLLAVVISGRWGGRDSAVLASFLGVLCFDYFLVPPFHTFAVSDAEYLITFSALLLVAVVVGTLTGQLRDHAGELRLREQETSALYAFSRSMVVARDLGEIAEATVSHVSASLARPVAVLLLKDQRPGFPTLARGATLTESELTPAMWTLEHGRPAGWPETTMPDELVGCIPLRTAHGTVGVLVARHPGIGRPLSSSQRGLMEAFAAQAAVVVERTRLAEEARRAQLLVEAEKLQDALLHSISHALRTPLASIIGSLSTLADPDQGQMDQATRNDLVLTAREEAERLNGLVGNLLDMTRLESGHMKLLTDWYDMADVIGAALGQADRSLESRPVRVQMEDDLPLVPLDQVLIVHVLENLLNNAVKYSPPGSPIDLQIQKVEGAIQAEVADRGVGIPAEEQERVFEKFYRINRPGSPFGTGLGLAICKGIVEAHRGRIWAAARPGGGTVITFTLPLQNIPGADDDIYAVAGRKAESQ
ncbi:MAG TPA: ATP-binding protein [Symbiobacteriaceae bacterium]|nr:ATP-binding protein [Symbiobacteriaceae bacterium]